MVFGRTALKGNKMAANQEHKMSFQSAKYVHLVVSPHAVAMALTAPGPVAMLKNANYGNSMVP